MTVPVFPFPVLVCDTGGTNVRFAVQAEPKAPLSEIVHLITDDYPGLPDAVELPGEPQVRLRPRDPLPQFVGAGVGKVALRPGQDLPGFLPVLISSRLVGPGEDVLDLARRRVDVFLAPRGRHDRREEILTEEILGGRRRDEDEMLRVTQATFTFVALDQNGRPRPIPNSGPAQAMPIEGGLKPHATTPPGSSNGPATSG